MRTLPVLIRPRRPVVDGTDLPLVPVVKHDDLVRRNDLFKELTSRVIGQTGALSQLVPYVHMYQAGLAPEGRPAGVFLLLVSPL